MGMPDGTGFDQAALVQKARRRQETRLAVLGPVMFAASLAGVLLALHAKNPPARLTSGGVLAIVLFCALPWLVIVGLLALVRRGRFASMQPTAFGGLGRRKRRAILRALRRGDPLAADEVPIARELVTAMQKSRWLPWLFLVLPLAQLGNLTEARTQRALWIVTAGAWWLLAWWQFYLRHRVRLYADTHWNR